MVLDAGRREHGRAAAGAGTEDRGGGCRREELEVWPLVSWIRAGAGAGPGDQSLFLVRTHLQSPCYRINTRSEGKEKNQEEPQDVKPEQSEGQSCHLPSWTSLAAQVC